MADKGVGCVVVHDGNTVRGIVTDRDLVLRVLAPGLGPDTPVSGAMSPGVTTVETDDDVHDAYLVFRRSGVRRLPVLDQGSVVGVLSVDDLLIDAFQRFADLLGPVAWSIFAQPGDDMRRANEGPST